MEERDAEGLFVETDCAPVTINTAIPSSNVGYKLLKKMGWKESTCLGLKGDGILEPIPVGVKMDSMGLGQREFIDSFTEPAFIAQRRAELQETELTSEDIERMVCLLDLLVVPLLGDTFRSHNP